MGIPLVALSANTQQPSPIEQYGKVLSLQNLMRNAKYQEQEQPLRIKQMQQQTAEGDIALQMKQLELKNSQVAQGAMSDPNFIKDYKEWRNKGSIQPAQPSQPGEAAPVPLHPLAQYLTETKGLSMFGPGGALEVSNALTGASQKQAELIKTQGEAAKIPLENHEKQLSAFDNLAEPVLAETDPTKQKQGIMNMLGEIQKNPQLYPPEMDLNKISTVDGLQKVANTSKIRKMLLDETKDKAEAAKAQQGVIPPGGGLSPEAQQQVQKDVAVATNPQIQQAEVNKAVRTEVAKQKALAVPLEQLTQTTMNGRKYINREDLPKEAAGVMEQQAAGQGVRVVDKDTAATLSDIDDAKGNMQTMLNLVKGKLASSPAERIYKGPENKLEAAMQTDPTLASMGTFRNAAIKTMRAVAGSKGLRINQYEVQLAIDNDIPKMTDTWEVAAKKIDTLNKFLDNAENAHLTMNRAKSVPAEEPATAKPTHRFNPATGKIEPI